MSSETMFFWRKDLKEENDKAIFEYIIIANPPENQDSLKHLIDKFNDTTDVLNCMLPNKNYFRKFFKESKRTPRDFEEVTEGYFDIDHLGGHYEDLLFTYSWYRYPFNKDSIVLYHSYYGD